MSITAQWKGGPWDGRTDELPDGCESIKIAIARTTVTNETPWYLRESMCYVEHELAVVQLFPDEYLIIWHEPQ